MNNFEVISKALSQNNADINKLKTEITSKEDSFIILNTDAFSGQTFGSGSSIDLEQNIVLNLFNVSSSAILYSQFRDYDNKTFVLKPTLNTFTVDSIEYTITSCSPCVGKIANYGDTPVLCLTFLIDSNGSQTALFQFCIFGVSDTEMVATLSVENFNKNFEAKQDKLVSGTNIKTINGNSIVGSGDIIINYPEVNHGTNDTTFTLTPNTFHVWDQVTSLTLTFGGETSGVANEYIFQFTSGPTATSLTLPNSIKWANGIAPTIAKNMIYQVSILKGLAGVLEFSNN